MTTTAPAPADRPTTGPTAARDTAPTTARDKVDLGTIAVVPTRHWWRWILSGLLLFVVAQFAWSLVTNDRYLWGTFAQYFFSEPVLIGIGYTTRCRSRRSRPSSASHWARCWPSAGCRRLRC